MGKCDGSLCRIKYIWEGEKQKNDFVNACDADATQCPYFTARDDKDTINIVDWLKEFYALLDKYPIPLSREICISENKLTIHIFTGGNE